MKRCSTVKGMRGKKKFRDAGEAAAYVRPGEARGLYLCPRCGFFHLTKLKQVA